MISKVFTDNERTHEDRYGNLKGEELSGVLHLAVWTAVEGSASASQTNL